MMMLSSYAFRPKAAGVSEMRFRCLMGIQSTSCYAMKQRCYGVGDRSHCGCPPNTITRKPPPLFGFVQARALLRERVQCRRRRDHFGVVLIHVIPRMPQATGGEGKNRIANG
jgi:hypothetical protein